MGNRLPETVKNLKWKCPSTKTHCKLFTISALPLFTLITGLLSHKGVVWTAVTTVSAVATVTKPVRVVDDVTFEVDTAFFNF